MSKELVVVDSDVSKFTDVLFLLCAGKKYYLNQFSKESQWERPTKPASKPAMDQVRCSHLLVKHRNSRRPSSWKEANITRTKEEAIEILNGKYSESGYQAVVDSNNL